MIDSSPKPDVERLFEASLCACLPLYEEKRGTHITAIFEEVWNRRFFARSIFTPVSIALATWIAIYFLRLASDQRIRLWARIFVEEFYTRGTDGPIFSAAHRHLRNLTERSSPVLCFVPGPTPADDYYEFGSPDVLAARRIALAAEDPLYEFFAERAASYYRKMLENTPVVHRSWGLLERWLSGAAADTSFDENQLRA